MATSQIPSAIQEVRRQLFLDTAEGRYLTVISDDLGVTRPPLGFSNDDTWRAVVKEIALDYKQIEQVFRDLLGVIFGPQDTVTTVLSTSPSSTDVELYIADPTRIPQLGTMVLDEGLAAEETVAYTFRHPTSGKVDLGSALANSHVYVDSGNALSYLTQDYSAGVTSIVVRDSSGFPTYGFPHALLLDAGETTEEVVELQNNAIATNTLTVSTTANAHSGPVATPVFSTLTSVEGGGSALNLADTSNFPSSGVVRVQEDGGTPVEDVEYYTNDKENNQLVLKAKVANTYTTAEVMLLEEQCSVQLGQVQVKGIGWDVLATEPRQLIIYLPEELQENRLIDVTFLHGPILSSTPSTVSGAHAPGDTILAVADASTFPEAGQVEIDSTETVGYVALRVDTKLLGGETTIASSTLNGAPVPNPGAGTLTLVSAAAFPNNGWIVVSPTDPAQEEILEYVSKAGNILTLAGVTANLHDSGDIVKLVGTPVGTTELYVGDAEPFYDYREVTKSLIIDRGGATEETVTWDTIDVATNKITLTAALTEGHLIGDTIELDSPNGLRLLSALTGTYVGGETVAVIENAYAGTSLEDGRAYYGSPPTTDHLYQGSYLWSYFTRIAETDRTTLNENVAGPLELEVYQSAARTSLEVRDASFINTSTYQQVRVGRLIGNDETVDVQDVVLRRDVTGVTLVGGPYLVGDTVLTIAGPTTLPQARGYRVFIDDNGSGGNIEEVGIVRTYDGATTLTLEEPGLQNARGGASGDNITLMADVIKVSTLSYAHEGVIDLNDRQKLVPGTGGDWDLGIDGTVIGPRNNRVARIEEVREYIDVVDASAYPSTGGYFSINYGMEISAYESQLTADETAGSGSVVVDDGSGFPSANFWVLFGIGTRILESIEVSSRAGNTLTLADNLLFTHRAGEWVRYEPGDTEIVQATGRETGGPNERLTFSPGIRFTERHFAGESVSLSNRNSIPSRYGTDYPFYLPWSWEDILKSLFDLARAAGVEVIITSDR